MLYQSKSYEHKTDVQRQKEIYHQVNQIRNEEQQSIPQYQDY